MKTCLLVFFCVLGVFAHRDAKEDPLLVSAPIGKIQGSLMTSRYGKPIYAFRGVRYAESPTGQQRFQPPIPAANWQDVFDATEEGPSCPQRDAKLQSEDCLRLNVYTTKLPSKNERVSRPVMVFIHPGGFYAFSGQSTNFGPKYLMEKDIVLVVINYRLGALGFLNTGDHLAPGNNGLKDQVIALRWVQRNIAAFGGDPNSVTLCGYSAGSFSIMLHMVSPMSKDLFHRAITMSSSPIGGDVYSSISTNGQTWLAKRQAEALDCPTDSTGSILLCLNTKFVNNFTDTLESLFDWRGNPILLWQPSVEPEVRGQERFLTDQPYNLIKQGKFHQVPMIMGVTEEEFGGVAVFYNKDDQVNNGSLYRELEDKWNTLLPIIFKYERDTPRSNYISQELKKFYLKDQPLGAETLRQLGDLYADGVIIFPMYRTAKLFAEYCREPVYFYKFTYEGPYSFYMWNDTTPYGVSHHDDLQYLFSMRQYFPYVSEGPDAEMMKLHTAMWSNFVITGEPIPRNDDKFKGISWSTFGPTRYPYLDINLHPTMKTEFFPERMRLWNRLFPLPGGTKSVKH